MTSSGGTAINCNYITEIKSIYRHLLAALPRDNIMPPKSASKGAMKKSASTSTGRRSARLSAKEKKRQTIEKLRPKKKSYCLYVYKVLRIMQPDLGISMKAMNIMNSFMDDMFLRLSAQAATVARINNLPTITSREFQTAVRLSLPKELAKHAVIAGTTAVTKYMNSE